MMCINDTLCYMVGICYRVTVILSWKYWLTCVNMEETSELTLNKAAQRKWLKIRATRWPKHCLVCTCNQPMYICNASMTLYSELLEIIQSKRSKRTPVPDYEDIAVLHKTILHW